MAYTLFTRNVPLRVEGGRKIQIYDVKLFPALPRVLTFDSSLVKYKTAVQILIMSRECNKIWELFGENEKLERDVTRKDDKIEETAFLNAV